MVSYCSLSNDRSLTKILLENNNNYSSKCCHRFVNTVDWADGLDIWSSTDIIKKSEISKRLLEFDDEIGIYFPKSEKFTCQSTPTKSDWTCSKEITKTILPERLKQLIQKESLSLSTEQLSISDENQTTNTNEKKSSNETNSNSSKVRFPLRQVVSRMCSRENQLKKDSQTINRENFQSLLKEQLSKMFSRETTNINSKRTVIQIPSVEIKHQTMPLKTTSYQRDSTSIIERYNQIQQLLISPSPNQTTVNTKLMENRQSPYIFQGVSTLGLTVTPLDYSSSRQFQYTSMDKNSQQDNSLSRIRPSTQPALVSSSMEQTDEQQRIVLKRNIETSFISSSAGNLILPTQNSHDQQIQMEKKSLRQHRPFPKHQFRRSKTFQLLPYIYGKHIDVNLSNKKNS